MHKMPMPKQLCHTYESEIPSSFAFCLLLYIKACVLLTAILWPCVLCTDSQNTNTNYGNANKQMWLFVSGFNIEENSKNGFETSRWIDVNVACFFYLFKEYIQRYDKYIHTFLTKCSKQSLIMIINLHFSFNIISLT